jgi:predicted RNA-binding protein YlxR (DUF448 family)
MVAVQNLKGEIIQLILSRKGGRGMYLVSDNLHVHAHISINKYTRIFFKIISLSTFWKANIQM